MAKKEKKGFVEELNNGVDNIPVLSKLESEVQDEPTDETPVEPKNEGHNSRVFEKRGLPYNNL
jgi:hypothetical protein